MVRPSVRTSFQRGSTRLISFADLSAPKIFMWKPLLLRQALRPQGMLASSGVRDNGCEVTSARVAHPDSTCGSNEQCCQESLPTPCQQPPVSIPITSPDVDANLLMNLPAPTLRARREEYCRTSDENDIQRPLHEQRLDGLGL